MRPNLHGLGLGAIMLLGLTIIAPGASATVQSEGFEDQISGSDPDPAEADGGLTYVFSEVGAGAEDTKVATTQARTGLRSVFTDMDGVSNQPHTPNYVFAAGLNWCDHKTLTYSIRFEQANVNDFLTSLTINTESNDLGSGTGDYVALNWRSTGALRLDVKVDSTTETAVLEGFTRADDTWYDVVLENRDPGGSCATEDIYAAVYNETGSLLSEAIVQNVAGTLDSSLDVFAFGSTTATNVDWDSDVWMDNLALDDGVALTPGSRFCANPNQDAGEDGSIDDFGYEYVEGVTFDSNIDDTQAELEEGFLFEHDDDGDGDFLGKGFNPGSTSWRTVARLEAAQETADSLFRIAYTTGAATPDTLGAKGDGTDGGNFDNHVQVRFEEVGDDWEMGIYANVAGAGLTLVDTPINFGNPNAITTFQFVVDSTNGPLGSGDGAAWVLDEDDTLIFSRTLPAGLQDATFKDQWFVGKRVGTAVFDARTYLDDKDGQDSTCIFDLVGTSTCLNTCGLAPDSETPPEVDQPSTCSSFLCTDTTSIPEGFTVATFNAFIGLMLVAMITVGGIGGVAATNPGFKVGSIVVAIFAFIGYLIAFNFGLLPLWPLVAAVVLAAGIVIMRLRSGA